MEASNEPSERRRKKTDPESPSQDEAAAQLAVAEPAEQPSGEARASDEQAEANSPRFERRRIEEQLEALKRKESELRRALAIADHPALADAIRLLEGHAFALGRVESKMAQGLSKAEERRRETLEKKLTSLREKRAELDSEITVLEGELSELGEQRTAALHAERHEALGRLIETMNAQHEALRSAGFDAAQLVPEIAHWMPEVEALAAHAKAGE